MANKLHLFSFHVKRNTDTATTIGKVVVVAETMEDARDYARAHLHHHYDADYQDISEESFLYPMVHPIADAVVISHITESEDE